MGSLPSHQLLWFSASITSTRDSNPDLPAPRPIALPRGHRVGTYIVKENVVELKHLMDIHNYEANSINICLKQNVNPFLSESPFAA